MDLIKTIISILMGIGGITLIILAIWQIVLIVKLHNINKN